ncbi:MAG TPA: hypothetical protein VIF40_18070 [Methylosinus sp.]|jgi:DNA (cytosine-5)-methyltransferase 1|uniref:hypothetical protein n=1 Tax=Methylosinus sp. TaxID=427 RepID=UPI002F95F56C
MTRPLALDLYCGAGGAAAGLYRAGFDVEGVDINPQPNYPICRGIWFVQRDALTIDPDHLRKFALIWASPPCQAHTAMKSMHNAKPHEDLIPATRAMLRASGALYVIENVPGAPLEDPVTLCGTMFGLGVPGAELRRHRGLEANFTVPRLECRHGLQPATIGLYGGHVRNRKRREGSHARGVADFSIAEGYSAMGIDWMSLTELSESIPPAYAEYVGLAARAALLRSRAA